jgi:glutamyl-tRNA synthetase
MSDKVVTRFAPSPTGFMHIGGVRTALFGYLWARKNNGTFILRIEDTDTERKVPGSVEHIQESLKWLGLTWDYGPDIPGPFGSCIQSERLSIYREFAEQLVAKGLAYPDPYTQEELTAFREQAQSEKRPFLYRDHRPSTFGQWDGTRPLRFKVANLKRYIWDDVVRGRLEAGEEALDDFILMKSDGYPTYNFAHIVDDHLMGVTHVLRADEFISSTPRFLSLYDALEIPRPALVTLPPILREDRTKKLGKRDGAKDILDYRREGYLPEAMVNYLALLGWNPGTPQEVFTLPELTAAFDIGKIQKAGAAFDEEKLAWFNREYLKSADDSVFAQAFRDAGQELAARVRSNVLRLARERSSLLSDIARDLSTGEYDFAFRAPDVDIAMIKWKKDNSPKDALPRLQRVLVLLGEMEDTEDPEKIKAALMPYAETAGKGEVLWPLRVALSGRERSPDPFTLIATIGIPEASSRIKTVCDKIMG